MDLAEVKDLIYAHVTAILTAPKHKRMDAYHAMMAGMRQLSPKERVLAEEHLRQELRRRVVDDTE